MTGIRYDPDVMRTFSYPTLQNRIYLEFDHLYRWHSPIPDVLNLGQGIPDVVFQPQLLLDVSHTAHASLCLLTATVCFSLADLALAVFVPVSHSWLHSSEQSFCHEKMAAALPFHYLKAVWQPLVCSC